jgi:hypothetical protein
MMMIEQLIKAFFLLFLVNYTAKCFLWMAYVEEIFVLAEFYNWLKNIYNPFHL